MLALTVASLSWSACGPRLQPAGGVAARACGVRMLEAYGEPAHPVFAKPKAPARPAREPSARSKLRSKLRSAPCPQIFSLSSTVSNPLIWMRSKSAWTRSSRGWR